MRTSSGFVRCALISVFSIAACGDDGGGSGIPADPDNGPIEATLTAAQMDFFPGMPNGAGGRVIRINNGYYEGEQISYWVVGGPKFFPAPKFTASLYVFCRQGDTACPLQAGAWNEAALLGKPVFDEIPTDDDYSPFWEVVVARVPDSYQPDTLKTVDSIVAQRDAGSLTLENLEVDFGGTIGRAAAIFNCPVVLDGTELEANGADLVGSPGTASISIPTKTAWYRGFTVKYLDFSVSEGFFPAVQNSQGVNEIPTAPIWLPHRQCVSMGTNPAICDAMSLTDGMLPVFEQELSMMAGRLVDLTSDGDDLDNNNVIAAGGPSEKGLGPVDPSDKPYSPLWEIRMTVVSPAADGTMLLIDTEGSETAATNMLRSVSELRAYIADGSLSEPGNVPEEMKLVPDGIGPIAGNEGKLFVNCPTQLPE